MKGRKDMKRRVGEGGGESRGGEERGNRRGKKKK